MSRRGPPSSPTPETTTEEPAAEPSPTKPSSAVPILPETARLFFIEPQDGASLVSPITLKFGVEGAHVRPAGEDAEHSGHHHLIINSPSIAHGTVVPKDDQHIHYGKGQTEDEVYLSPGVYTLTMQFANYQHVSYGAQGAASIQITVTE